MAAGGNMATEPSSSGECSRGHMYATPLAVLAMLAKKCQFFSQLVLMVRFLSSYPLHEPS